MSRRQKRRAQQKQNLQATSPRSRKKTPWLALGLSVVLCAACGGYFAVNSYMHGDKLRLRIADSLAESVGAPVEISELRWRGLHLSCQQLLASSKGGMQSIEARGLDLDVATDLMKRDVWEVSNIEVDHLQLDLDLTKPFTSYEAAAPPRSWLSDLLPKSTEIEDFAVHQLDARWQTSSGGFLMENAALSSEGQHGDLFLTHCRKGEITLPFSWCRGAQLDELKVRHSATEFDVIHGMFDLADEGKIFIEGSADTVTKQYLFHGELRDLKVAKFLKGKWSNRVSGDANSEFEIKPSKITKASEVSGRLEVEQASLSSVPTLKTFARYTGVSALRDIQFDTAVCDYTYRAGVLQLRDIRLNSGELLSVTGQLEFEGSSVNGVLHIGMKPYVFERIPNLLGSVFVIKEDGYAWMEIQVKESFEKTLSKVSRQIGDVVLGELLSGKGIADTLKLGVGVFEKVLEPKGDGKESSPSDRSSLEDELLKQSSETVSGVLDAAFGGFLGSSQKTAHPKRLKKTKKQ